MGEALSDQEGKSSSLAPATEVAVASRITGTGFSVPERVVSNEHFESYLDTNDAWIRERTGIAERRWAGPEESASSLAEPAARMAIERAGLKAEDIDGIIVATVTPDYAFPSTACLLQKRLAVGEALAFDVNAVCSGFVYALTTADSYIRSGICRNIVVVGVDLYSRIINPNDRGTCILFGDGAGAVVLSAVSTEGDFRRGDTLVRGDIQTTPGIYSSLLGADGNYEHVLCVPNGTANQPTAESMMTDAHYLTMEGREVFKLAVRKLGDISTEILERFGLPPDSVDYFVSHQANKRILLSMAKHMKVDEKRIPMNLDRYGNTSAATIPLLLAELDQEGKINSGDLLMLNAFGGGVTWGAILLRW